MKKEMTIGITVGKEEVELEIDRILYITMKRNNAYIHIAKDKVYPTRMTLVERMDKLGDTFILVHRSILVSARAIHEIGDKIYLNNGEELEYVVRKKQALQKQLHAIQKRLLAVLIRQTCR